jgi:hypothetical protein
MHYMISHVHGSDELLKRASRGTQSLQVRLKLYPKPPMRRLRKRPEVFVAVNAQHVEHGARKAGSHKGHEAEFIYESGVIWMARIASMFDDMNSVFGSHAGVTIAQLCRRILWR